VFDVFGETQIYLYELATHPDYQLKGAGTPLIELRIENGRRDGVDVTLVAQPSAKGSYFKKGFIEIRNISVNSVDGDQTFWCNVMSYDFDNAIPT
jgi:GNAT superfamily N-acetyltransferase